MKLAARFRIEILLFLILLACYAYFPPRWADWNQNSRLNLTLAIVDDGSFQIDRFVANTGDYAKYNGHYYSDKAPGTSFLAVPMYAAVRPALQTAPAQRIINRVVRQPPLVRRCDPMGAVWRRRRSTSRWC